MKKGWVIVMAGLLVAAMALPAFAWEFEMKGEYEYRTRWWQRMGNADLFGLASAQDSASPYPHAATSATDTGAGWVGLAGPNMWNGALPGAPASGV